MNNINRNFKTFIRDKPQNLINLWIEILINSSMLRFLQNKHLNPINEPPGSRNKLNSFQSVDVTLMWLDNYELLMEIHDLLPYKMLFVFRILALSTYHS